jgi:SecD/SecF fusion protein
MIFGVAVGTYSSIFIAAPVLILFKLRADNFRVGLDAETEGETPPEMPGQSRA